MSFSMMIRYAYADASIIIACRYAIDADTPPILLITPPPHFHVYFAADVCRCRRWRCRRDAARDRQQQRRRARYCSTDAARTARLCAAAFTMRSMIAAANTS